MKKTIVYSVTSIVIFLLIVLSGSYSKAIPAFARKYQISCQVCHSPAMPRLKGFGEEFASNGFKLEGYESPRFFIQTGDDRLSLFRELPLAIRFDGFATYNFNNEDKTDFASPFVLKILSGGEMSDNLSYYFYFLMNEKGSIVGVEDAFLMYKDLFKTGINFYIGQFQVSDPLFKGELRYTLEPYKIYGATPGNSTASLKYERGIVLEKGFSTGTSIVGQVVSGSGLGDAGESLVFDKDKHKNYMLRISQSIGEKFSIGAFGYSGKEDLEDDIGLFTSNLTMYGPDIKFNYDEKLIINLQYLQRTDSDVFIESDGSKMENVKTQGGFGEIIFSPKGDMSKWYLTGLFNWIESDFKHLEYKAATLHAGYMVRRNVKLVTEYTWQFSGKAYGRLNAGFVMAF
ncbi:MAG: hypothetical protein AB9846_10110 [Tenuifilaceae bacterium]